MSRIVENVGLRAIFGRSVARFCRDPENALFRAEFIHAAGDDGEAALKCAVHVCLCVVAGSASVFSCPRGTQILLL